MATGFLLNQKKAVTLRLKSLGVEKAVGFDVITRMVAKSTEVTGKAPMTFANRMINELAIKYIGTQHNMLRSQVLVLRYCGAGGFYDEHIGNKLDCLDSRL